MKDIRVYGIGIFITSCLYSCSKSSVKDHELAETGIAKAEEVVEDIASFESDTTYGFEVQSPSPDTFKLVSHSWYFWYPYGKFSTPEELKEHYSGRFNIEEEIYPSSSDPSEKATLYRLKINNGFIKFFHTTWEEDSENNDMAIVSAKVTEPAIQMTNGLKVGLTRDEVKEILFGKGEPNNIRNYKNILIATILDGVWVHLNFEGDRLSRIVVETDCQLNKE